MNEAATRSGEYSTSAPVLYVAFELGEKRWQVGFTTGFGQRARRRWLPSRSVERLGVEFEAARERFGLPVLVPVVSCCEAGRDGFWLHRYLASAGVENVVVDASSIEVPRRLRQAKTDRLDLESLLRLLIRHHAGERGVWRIVHVPSRAIEDARQLHRDVEVLKRDRTRVTNRIKGLLAGQGVSGVSLGPGFEAALDELRLWDGSSLSTQLKARLVREWTRGRDLTERIRENEKLRASQLAESEDPAMEQVRQLMRLRGVAVLIDTGARLSYSERGAKDNPWIESFWSRFKGENGSLIADAETIPQLRDMTGSQIHYYNHDRRHSSIDYTTPRKFLMEFLKTEREARADS